MVTSYSSPSRPPSLPLSLRSPLSLSLSRTLFLRPAAPTPTHFPETPDTDTPPLPYSSRSPPSYYFLPYLGDPPLDLVVDVVGAAGEVDDVVLGRGGKAGAGGVPGRLVAAGGVLGAGQELTTRRKLGGSRKAVGSSGTGKGKGTGEGKAGQSARATTTTVAVTTTVARAAVAKSAAAATTT